MHVLGLLLIIILICYAAIYWYITVPLIALLVYLYKIITPYVDTFSTFKPTWRFHFRWWLFLITLVTVLYNRQEISFFFDDYQRERPHFSDSDDLLERVYHYSDTTLIHLGSTPSQKSGLYAGYRVGMFPLQVTWYNHFNPQVQSHITIGDTWLSTYDRYYYHNRLYGLTFHYEPDSTDHNHSRELVRFLSQKYGQPHHLHITDTLYRAHWQYSDKHLLVECIVNEVGDLYIFHPKKLRQKFEAQLHKDRMEEAQLEEKKRKAEEQRIKEIQRQEEEKREQELTDQKLRESL